MGMRRFLIPVLFILLLSSCDMVSYRTVTVSFPEEHFWEYVSGRQMWHTLVFFDGETVQRRSITGTDRKVSVRVKRGATAVFTVYPLDSLCPKGGGIAPWQGREISLHETEGLLAETLIAASEYNPDAIAALDYATFKEKIPEDFDTDELLYSIADGSFSASSVKLAKKVRVTVSAIPAGVYYPESESGDILMMKSGSGVVLELIPGVHRYYNHEAGTICIVAVTTEGESEYRLYKAASW